VARLILKADWHESSVTMLKRLGWMSVKERLYYSTCVLMYKVMHHMAPDYLNVFVERECTYALRNRDYLVVPHPRNNLFKTSFHYQGALCWNELPENVMSSQSLQSFKLALKNYILFGRTP
jgi:hypothetical protein